MANLAPAFDTQFFDGQTVAAGYKLYTYETGTTTPKTTYSDQAGAIPNTNPITLDADGRCSLWLGDGEYAFALYTREIGDGGSLVKTWTDVGAGATSADVAEIEARVAAIETENENVINVKSSAYGAVGDGSTDDTLAIQNAIAAVPLSSGGPTGQGGYVVLFPPGKYKISATLFIGSRRVSFLGMGGGIIGSNGTMIFTTDPNVTLIDYSTGSLDTFSMYNMQLRGAGKGSGGSGNGIILGRVSGQTAFDSQIERCWIVGMPGAGIVLQNSVNYQIQQGAIELCTRGVVVKQSLSGSGDNNQISAVTFYGNDMGVNVESGTGLCINDNVFWLNGVGAGSTGDNVSGGIVINSSGAANTRGVLIDGNSFRANTNDIIVNGNNGTNTSNTGVNDVNISGNQSQLAYRRFAYVQGANAVSIVSNKINGCSQEAHNTFDAIEVVGTSDKTFIDGNSLTNNNASTRQRYGLNLGSTTTRTAVGINHFEGATSAYNIAAGATLDNEANLKGTWTPVLKGNATAGTQTYSVQDGTWERIGNVVHIRGSVYLSGLDGATSGTILIDGLPFLSAKSINPSVGSWGGCTTTGPVTMRGTAGQTFLNMLQCSLTGAGPAALAVANISSSFSVEFSATYAAA